MVRDSCFKWPTLWICTGLHLQALKETHRRCNSSAKHARHHSSSWNKGEDPHRNINSKTSNLNGLYTRCLLRSVPTGCVYITASTSTMSTLRSLYLVDPSTDNMPSSDTHKPVEWMNCSVQARQPRLPGHQWDRHRAEILREFASGGLPHVMQHMQSKYGFNAEYVLELFIE